MSMSTRVVGFRPPDETWKRMKAIWDACDVAGVSIPDEVMEFFDDQVPDPSGVEVKIEAREWRGDMRDGYEVDVDQIPAGVKVIRFENSW